MIPSIRRTGNYSFGRQENEEPAPTTITVQGTVFSIPGGCPFVITRTDDGKMTMKVSIPSGRPKKEKISALDAMPDANEKNPMDELMQKFLATHCVIGRGQIVASEVLWNTFLRFLGENGTSLPIVKVHWFRHLNAMFGGKSVYKTKRPCKNEDGNTVRCSHYAGIGIAGEPSGT